MKSETMLQLQPHESHRVHLLICEYFRPTPNDVLLCNIIRRKLQACNAKLTLPALRGSSVNCSSELSKYTLIINTWIVHVSITLVSYRDVILSPLGDSHPQFSSKIGGCLEWFYACPGGRLYLSPPMTSILSMIKSFQLFSFPHTLKKHTFAMYLS